MIDFNRVMTEELDKRRAGNMFHPQGELPTEAYPGEADELQALRQQFGQDMHRHSEITINEETDLNGTYGPQQVQSLLGLALDFSLRKKLADATDDVDAVRHLHRIKNPGG